MSTSQSTSDLYRLNITRSADRLKSRNIPLDQELYDLCNLTGVTLDSQLFQILLDLIRMNVSPNALVQVLKKMTKQAGTRGSLPSDTSRSTSVSSDSAFETRSTIATIKDEPSMDSERSNMERLTNRLRVLKANRKT